MPERRVAKLNEIGDSTQTFVKIDGRSIYLTRIGGKVFAADTCCPCPLSSGILNRLVHHEGAPSVQCDAVCYTLTFDLETGRNTRGWNFEVQTYPTRIMDGEVFVEI